MDRLVASILAILLATATPTAARELAGPEIWFNPLGSQTDTLNMWTANAPWQEAAKNVQVLTLVHWWILKQTDAKLIEIRDFAKQHNIRIDLNTEPIARLAGDTCGMEEGYMSVQEINWDVQLLTRLGFDLDWVDMDAPVGFGVYSPGPNGCQYSIPDLVGRIAMILQPVFAAYPNVKVMEIEPFSITQSPTWREDETAFHMQMQRQLGRRPRGIMVDMQWQVPGWQPAMLELHRYLRQENLKYSIIYNGNAQSKSDVEWMNSAVSNIEAIEGGLGIIPDEVLFTSWDRYPTLNMPETLSTAETWLINRYARPRSTIQVQFVGRGAHGKLATRDGKPIANATVNGFKPGVDLTRPLPVTVMQATVPAAAVSVLIGVRVNVECDCSGLNDILFGTIQYQETQGGSAQASYSFPTTPRVISGAVVGGEIVGGTTVTRVIANVGSSLALNSSWFPVTGGAQYQLTIPAATIGGNGWFGNVLLIWRDAKGSAIGRVVVTPPTGKALMSTAVTRSDGTFDLGKLPRSSDGPNPVSVEFDGGAGAYRSTSWNPLR